MFSAACVCWASGFWAQRLGLRVHFQAQSTLKVEASFVPSIEGFLGFSAFI